MKGFAAFFAKECREMLRKKRLLILLILFGAFGILNVGTALLTPKILEKAMESYDTIKLTVGEATALDAWTQFAKNAPTALIVLLLMFGGIYTSEYSKGTLIPLLTKGLSRSAVVLSKFAVMLLTWSACIWLCFIVTYIYSAYYWDNSVVEECGFSGLTLWLFGIFMISCIVFFSSVASTATQVLLGTGGVYFAMTLAGLSEKAAEYLPTCLCNVTPLYTGIQYSEDYLAAIGVTLMASAVLVLAAVCLTRKRQL